MLEGWVVFAGLRRLACYIAVSLFETVLPVLLVLLVGKAGRYLTTHPWNAQVQMYQHPGQGSLLTCHLPSDSVGPPSAISQTYAS
jgi:hypothetical protein